MVVIPTGVVTAAMVTATACTRHERARGRRCGGGGSRVCGGGGGGGVAPACRGGAPTGAFTDGPARDLSTGDDGGRRRGTCRAAADPDPAKWRF